MFGRTTTTGIDLGTANVRMVILDAKRGGGRFVLADTAPVERADDQSAKAAWGDAIAGIMRRHGLQPRHLGRVALSVGGDSLTVRQFDLPELTDAELANAIPLEARRHVPLPHNTEIAIAHHVLARDRERKRIEIVLSGCPRSLVTDSVAAAKLAGLEPVIVDAAPLAAMNAIIHASPAPCDEAAFLDIGHSGSTFTLYRAERFLLSRRIMVGGESMTREVAEREKISFEDAALIVRGETKALSATLLFVIGESLRRLAAEVKASIDFCEARTGRKGLSNLLVGGGAAGVVGLAHALEEKLGVPVAIADPLPPFAKPPILGAEEAARLARESSQLAIAFGLARWWES